VGSSEDGGVTIPDTGLREQRRRRPRRDGGDGDLGQSADGEQSHFDQHGEAPTPNIIMRLATSERTLNPAVMSKKGVDNEPAIKGPIDSRRPFEAY
jgi:hypothetical protein